MACSGASGWTASPGARPVPAGDEARPLRGQIRDLRACTSVRTEAVRLASRRRSSLGPRSTSPSHEDSKEVGGVGCFSCMGISSEGRIDIRSHLHLHILHRHLFALTFCFPFPFFLFLNQSPNSGRSRKIAAFFTMKPFNYHCKIILRFSIDLFLLPDSLVVGG